MNRLVPVVDDAIFVFPLIDFLRKRWTRGQHQKESYPERLHKHPPEPPLFCPPPLPSYKSFSRLGAREISTAEKGLLLPVASGTLGPF